MQQQAKAPPGIVYITSMDRPDAALALSMLYIFQSRRECRLGSVCVSGSGLNAAIFCDIVYRFYRLGPPQNANEVLPPGLSMDGTSLSDPPMLRNVIASPYPRSVSRVSDTSLAEAVIRNGVIFNARTVMILSAPATALAKSLDVQGTRELYRERVKMLIVVDSGAHQEAAAMRQVLAEFPAPIVFCGKEIGDQAPYPGASIAQDFSWTASHPVADAYRAYKTMPYDAPSCDLAAAFYAVHPENNLLRLAEPGKLTVDDGGGLRFSPGESGATQSLVLDAADHSKIVQAYIEAAAAKPIAPARRNPPPK